MKITYVMIVFILLYSCLAAANKLVEGKSFKDLEKQSVKCSVVLTGGKTTVLRYYNIPVRDRSMLESEIKAKGVDAGNNHYSIHKIKECINFNKKFKDAISRQLDIATSNNG